MASKLPSVAQDTEGSPMIGQRARKLGLLKGLRPPPFKYAWNFYHDKHNENSSYEGRLTLMFDNIITAKPFWETLNSFPLEKLQLRDSVHFFKRGVKPVWEDPRNVKGGAWTFRVPKAQAAEFWKEMLMMAVGEQFADVIQPGDDLCGLSLSVRFNSDLITIWNRQGENEKTKEGILAVILHTISPDLKPLAKNCYYKRHSEHAGFSEVVAKARDGKVADGKIAEAVVKDEEGDKALLKEAEEIDIKELQKEDARA